MKKLISLLSFSFLISPSVYANQNFNGLPDDTELTFTVGELKQMQSSSSGSNFFGGGKSCLNSMIDQVSQGMTSKFEQQQQEANSLMGISEKFANLAKECRNDLGQDLIKFEQSKLDLEKAKNGLNASMKKQEIEYKRALLGVKRQCDSTANQQFGQMKAATTNPNAVVSAQQGGPRALFGRNKRVNKFRKLFYDSCMADPITIEEMRIAGLEMAANVEEIQANLKSANDTFASVTKQIEFSQDLTVRNCAEGKDQLEYQERLIKSVNAQAVAMVKKQNMFGLLGAGIDCIFGPNSVVPGFAPDAGGNRAPATSSTRATN